MGLEPTVSSVTGWHVNRLHHGSAILNGGRCRIRTYDPLLVRQVLSPAELIARVFDNAFNSIPKIIPSVNRQFKNFY